VLPFKVPCRSSAVLKPGKPRLRPIQIRHIHCERLALVRPLRD
jgi:hypothetical protein